MKPAQGDTHFAVWSLGRGDPEGRRGRERAERSMRCPRCKCLSTVDPRASGFRPQASLTWSSLSLGHKSSKVKAHLRWRNISSLHPVGTVVGWLEVCAGFISYQFLTYYLEVDQNWGSCIIEIRKDYMFLHWDLAHYKNMVDITRRWLAPILQWYSIRRCKPRQGIVPGHFATITILWFIE